MMAGRVAASVSAVLVSALLLAACRAEEQGRILQYEKGQYLGQADSKLSGDQVRTLSARTGRQGG